MDDEPQRPSAARRGEIDDRLAAIRARIQELANGRVVGADMAVGRLLAAERNAAASFAAAQQAASSSAQAFCRAAEAHEHMADIYDKLAGSGSPGAEQGNQLAAFHRAAAAADRARADEATAHLANVADEPGAAPGT